MLPPDPLLPAAADHLAEVLAMLPEAVDRTGFPHD
jgi:hypothetical protein